MRTTKHHVQLAGSRLSAFDYLALAGAAVNVIVIVVLVGHWLVAG